MLGLICGDKVFSTTNTKLQYLKNSDLFVVIIIRCTQGYYRFSDKYFGGLIKAKNLIFGQVY